MANYNKNARHPRPQTMDRSGPRFSMPLNRNFPRHPFNDNRPPLPKQNIASLMPNKPSTEIKISTPTTASDPGSQIEKSKPEQNTSSSVFAFFKFLYNKMTCISSTTSSNTTSSVDAKPSSSATNPIPTEEQIPMVSGGQKRRYSGQQSNSAASQKTTQGGRSRLFIGNIPSNLTQEEFQTLFEKYGELIEYYVNPSRGFGFVKLSSRQLAEQAKCDLDGHILRGKPLRIRFASQGAIVKVKNLSPNVSNELLKEAFEQYFGGVERAVIIVDDRGKSTGEGIVEFEKKPSAQKCLNDCTEKCFFITGDLRPIIVEPWDMKDEDDGLPDKSLMRNDAYFKERELQPRFAEPNTIEYTIGLKWKQLEIQEKQLLEEVKTRMQYASEQLKVETEQMQLEYQAQVLRDELTRRQEDLRRIDELRSQDFERRRSMMSIHHPDAYNASVGNAYHQNVGGSAMHPYNNNHNNNNFQQASYGNSPQFNQQTSPIDAAYTTNQASRGYNLQPGPSNIHPGGVDFNHQQQGFDRKRPRY
ncbi:unnamed protein product [Rotaria magnacalcarata]|uniref:RRM domain-containing protein n=2 Tax=Rotaria magnacalcarata TaxID=392030 RepID=A0A819FHP0_9BILA|nr:unnamed protein product [Rotaria magnacalcarata]CAF3914765.1 unnamed protein product [Rotaria magnacalcarata]